jgi:3-oxoacyl-[acyl-carrier-protein] synthase III
VFYISSACSSGMNAFEAASAYFTAGLARRALLICADRNSSFSDDTDSIAGHLWGDAAVAFFLSSERYSDSETEVLDINTQGLAHIGLGPEAVKLSLPHGPIQMPFGKDVFTYACTYIAQNTKKILEENGYGVDDLTYFIGHQANMRILKNVANRLGLPENKSLSNIEKMGNTGSASALLVYAMNDRKFESNNLVCMSVFGGGYSAGACLMLIGQR